MEKATITVDIIGRHEREGHVHVHIENPQCNIRTWVPESEVTLAKAKAETNDEKKPKAETGEKPKAKAETNDEKKD